MYCMIVVNNTYYVVHTVRHKILTGENIDEFDEFPAIRQYFPYQNFLFNYLLTYMK